MIEDEIQNEARALAREAGVNPDEIVEADEPEPVVEDRGDGLPVTIMRRPLRPRWKAFEAEARVRVLNRPDSRRPLHS